MFFSHLTTIVLLLLAVHTFSAPQKKSTDENFKLIILHNNDMHARFEQTNAASARCTDEDREKNNCYGGFARVAHVVRDYRKRANTGEIPRVLYLNAGDTYTGTPWFALFKDNITSAFLELLKPDAISLGNHEFDEGTENLAKFLKEIDFPVLAANLDLEKEPSLKVDILKPSHIFEIDGIKIGVVGYLTPETKEVAKGNQVEFIDEIEAINKEAARLKEEGIKIIIALGHSGIERDKQIAMECPDIDLIIGGHSHTFLYNGTKPDIDEPYDTYPIMIVQRNGKKVPVVQSYAYTKYLGYIHLEFDGEGNMVEIDGNPILLNHDIPREQDVLDLLQKYRPAVLALQTEVVGQTRVNLEGSCRRVECNLGNFIADSMVDWNALRYDGIGWTDAAIGIIQGGGVRASITRTVSGNITMEDIATVLPFDSKVVVIEITGETLLKAFEHSVARYTEGEGRGEFLQYSGVQIEYDMNRESGNRVVNVKVLCAYCEVPQLEDLVLHKTYRIVMQDFLANGGDGYEMFKNSQVGIETETVDVDVLKSYMLKKSPIYPAVEWRITIKDLVDPNDEIVGSSRVFLDGNCYTTECNLGNFITDAFVDWYAMNSNVQTGWTDASIALIPARNIQFSIDPKETKGDITKALANKILPLNNKLVVVEISGAVFMQALEHAVSSYYDGAQTEFLQMSGVQVEYDINNEVGSRVVSAKILCSSCTLPELETINTSANYKILMPQNLANGDEGYTMFSNHISSILEVTELDAFLNYLKKKSPIYPAIEWRITIKNFVDPSVEVVGSTRVFLNNDCSLGECNLGNFITDAMVDWYSNKYNKDEYWTDASIAVIQGSRIKASIDAKANNGSIFKSDVEKIFSPIPFTLQLVTLKGSELLDMLEYSISSYTDEGIIDTQFLQLSGIQVVYDTRKASGSRITDIKVLCAQCSVPELVNVDRNLDYKIIMQSAMLTEDYYNVISSNKIEELDESDMNAFLNYLKKKSPIYPAVEWRITILGDEVTTTTEATKTTTGGSSNLQLSLALLLISILMSFLNKS
ncbi:hypothetical protein PVAND_006914 [Polypedilum vanderplanki]|uniref:5' nucleotidase n=1 Tax=Polypedilum vanderplanki TaxID=319348 RepID=A0A9J6C4M6_POLVA|nr:hypothetical protein PVAND_006914 [Polypedilum vanderplanki]